MPGAARGSSAEMSSRCASSWTASWRRAAALPVGAASATSGGAAPAAAACSSSRATIRATVVVLPVPGPPATTARRRSTAAAAATFWSVSGSSAVNSRWMPAARTPRSAAAAVGQAREVGGDLRLLAPVAVQVQGAAASRSGRSSAHATSGLAATRAAHADGSGHGSAARSTGSSASTVAVCVDPLQVDEDVAESRRAHRERGREHDARRRSRPTAQRASAPRAHPPPTSTPASLNCPSSPEAERATRTS